MLFPMLCFWSLRHRTVGRKPAARVRDCAAEAAGAVEAHGYDLFLAANGGDAADAGADGEAGR